MKTYDEALAEARRIAARDGVDIQCRPVLYASDGTWTVVPGRRRSRDEVAKARLADHGRERAGWAR